MHPHQHPGRRPAALILLATLLPQAPLPAAPPVTTLEPLVVSAEGSPREVLTRDDLSLYRPARLVDLAGLAPGFGVVTSDTRGYGDILSMRGAANTLFFSPPAVGMVIDDVPLADTFSYPSALLELEQVKLLRGPQAAIYGVNGAAGLIDMSTPLPGDSQRTGVRAGYGSYHSWDAGVTSSGPLGRGFSHALQFYHQQREGYIYDSTLDRAIDDRSLTGGLINLFWKPSDDTEWRLRVAAERADDGGPRLSLLDSPNPYRVESDLAGETLLERYQVSLHWTKEGPWGRLKSITAWQDWDLDPSVTDLNLSAIPGWYSRIQQDQEVWSQEFRWESPRDAGPWSWRTGLFLMNQSTAGDGTRAFTVNMGFFDLPVVERTRHEIDQWNAAAYGRLAYQLNPRLQVMGGARLEYVASEIDRTKTDNFFSPPGIVRDQRDDMYFSPEVGASYALCDRTRLFARSAVGIKPAGFSAYAGTPDLAGYDDETAWSNELGLETSWPEQNLTFSLTGYWNRIHDYQVNRSLPDSTDYYTANAGTVDALGVESTVQWQPLTGLTLHGSAGFVQAEFDSGDNSGNPVPFVPDFTASLAARYELPAGFYLQSALRMTGETFFDENQDPRYHQGSYLCWDAEVGYQIDNYSVALFGRNLLDREYYTFINGKLGQNQQGAGSPGDPQVFGIRAGATF